jgi:O-antigen ligase
MSIESYVGGFGLDVPSEPIVIILAGCVFVYLIFNKDEFNSKAFRNIITVVILLQFSWSVFTLLHTTNLILSVKYVLAKAWYLLGFYFATILFIRSEKELKKLFWCLFIPTLLSVIYVMIRHAELSFTFDSIQHAVSPIYRNHVSYAVFITMVLPFIFLAKSWYIKTDYKFKILKYSIPIFLTAIYFSYTRGAWLATVEMAIYYIIIHFKLTKQVLVISFITVISFCTYILSNNNYLKYSPDFEHTIYHDDLSKHLTSTFEMEDMSTVERFYRWIAAVKMIQKHPAVGVGPNNFVSNYKEYTVTAYETYISENEEKSTVHNYFLLLFAEQGFPAVVLFSILIAAILIMAENTYHLSDIKTRRYIAFITLCIVAFLINNTLSDLVEINKLGSLFFISVALIVNFATGRIMIDEQQDATNLSDK